MTPRRRIGRRVGQIHVPDQKQSNVQVVLSTSECFLTSQLRATDGEDRSTAGGSGDPSLNLAERARKSSFLAYRAGLPRSGSPVRFRPIHPPRERTIAPNRGGVIRSRCLEERGGRKEAGVEEEVEVEDNAEYDSRFWDSKHYAAEYDSRLTCLEVWGEQRAHSVAPVSITAADGMLRDRARSGLDLGRLGQDRVRRFALLYPVRLLAPQCPHPTLSWSYTYRKPKISKVTPILSTPWLFAPLLHP
ncbi:hypothetical protein CVT26_008919 [Gymnopilus dilepis]|uniref:Uncharacterized protein n=1 Tax=Gymnopilus dilepis TaxID=231916 RepID=A0A409YAM0_9AGAR|nr:hypothetical protein CVT26_008919 [Gymnopilus dilepis]